MAEVSTVSRPYSQAVFKLAKEKNQLGAWSKTLQFLVQLMADSSVRAMIQDPNVPTSVVLDILFEISADNIDSMGKNFLKILAENQRLPMLPEIAAQYEILRTEASNTIDAELVSAFKVSDAEQEKVIKGLKKRLGQDVKLTCRIDPKLICGAIVRAGDLVIDGSMASRIEHLATELGS